MNATNQPNRIFISSTFSDLVDYREAVHAAIHRLENHADDMIFWSADERSPDAVSADNVKQADFMVLIVGHKYGSIVSNDTRSFTELEYDTAKANGVPVFAFFVEPFHPWPPTHVDIESEKRDLLSRFKVRVERECVRQYFTTTESLAMLVTQAVANFDKRRTGSVGAQTLRRSRPIAFVKPRSELSNRPNLAVEVGESEDGLELVLLVERSQNLRDALWDAAKYLERTPSDPPLDAISRVLFEEGERIWKRKRLFDVSLPDGDVHECYVSSHTLTELFAPSLLTSVMSLPRGFSRSSSYDDYDSGLTSATPIASREGLDERVESFGGSNRFLAVSLKDQSCFAVGWDEGTARFIDPPTFWRHFVNESLAGFAHCTFSVTEESGTRTGGIAAEGALENYRDTMLSLLESQNQNAKTQFLPRFRVTRGALAQVILNAVHALAHMHAKNLVHADLKPQNVMVSRNECKLIDELPLQIGEISPSMSPGWSAPEQIVLQPVSMATDVFPLGLMLVSLLDGQLTGKVSEYMMPDAKEDVGRTISCFENPIVYLSPQSRVMHRQSRKPWLDFVEKCLRFKSAERPQNAQDFITELEELLQRHPIEGSVFFELRRKEFPRLARMPDGRETVSRLIVDGHSKREWYQYDEDRVGKLLSEMNDE